MKLRFSKSNPTTPVLILPILLLCCVIISSEAFTPIKTTQHNQQQSLLLHNNKENKRYQPLNLAAGAADSTSSSSSSSSSLPEIDSMKASDLRKELQSYGISTKSFFEKSELVDAVEKARKEGKTSFVNGDDDKANDDSNATSTSGTKAKGKESKASRQEKLAIEIEKCTKMKVGELKKELESYGISTKSFFEKSEFVKAVAEARVDGVKNKGGSRRGSASREEEYDPSYRDVQMQKMDVRALGMSPVIDVRLG